MIYFIHSCIIFLYTRSCIYYFRQDVYSVETDSVSVQYEASVQQYATWDFEYFYIVILNLTSYWREKVPLHKILVSLAFVLPVQRKVVQLTVFSYC